MTTLAFTHNGWRVVTNSWSAASKWENKTRIVYTWGPDGISFFDSRVSTSAFDVELPISAFERATRSTQFLDLDRFPSSAREG